MSNFYKRTKRAWEENEFDKVHPNSRPPSGLNSDYTRQWPLCDEDCRNPDQKKALFPREILQPLYEKWNHLYNNGSNSAESFFRFLLEQSKP